MATQSSIKGAVKVAGVPDSACFTTFADLLRSLGTYLTVEIPNQTFSNVVISNSQPGQADRDKIWWRLSNSGSFVGIYYYSGGVWVQIFPAPQQITWLFGDSSNPPPGYSFDLVQTVFSAPDYAALIAMAIPVGGPTFVYYPALFTGV
jgi:hypothetical protein